jgi:DNA-binding MarR family transcriptional regulator
MAKSKSAKLNNQHEVFKLDDRTRNLYVLMSQTHDTIRNANELELEQYGVNEAQIRILFMLTQEKKGMTLNDMSKWILRKFNSISTLVNRMEQKGLVKRSKSTADGKVYIMMTPKGRELFERINERAIHLIFKVLSDEEKKELHAMLKRLRIEGRKLLGLDYKPPFLP